MANCPYSTTTGGAKSPCKDNCGLWVASESMCAHLLQAKAMLEMSMDTAVIRGLMEKYINLKFYGKDDGMSPELTALHTELEELQQRLDQSVVPDEDVKETPQGTSHLIVEPEDPETPQEPEEGGEAHETGASIPDTDEHVQEVS